MNCLWLASNILSEGELKPSSPAPGSEFFQCYFLLEKKSIDRMSLGYYTAPIFRKKKNMWSSFLQRFQVSSAPCQGFPGGSVVRNLPANAGDAGSIPGLGRSPGEGNDNPLQYFCLGNPMDREAWSGHSPWGQKEADTT